MRILLTAATVAIALTATPAQARSGYAACVAIQPLWRPITSTTMIRPCAVTTSTGAP